MKPRRLVDCRLDLMRGKRYAEFIAWGDVHYGAPNCNIKKAKGYLDYALKHGQYILGMGDFLECATRDSIGAGVYEQTGHPQEQMEEMIEWLRPISESGRLIGLLTGNHEERIYKATGFEPVQLMCKELRVPYLGSACYLLLRVGSKTYKVYAVHGRSGARLPQTKLLACRRLADIATAQLYLMGHMHSLESNASIYFDADPSKRLKVQRTRHFVVTGSFLEYENSYAETACMVPSRTGAPKIVLEADSNDIHISL